jgi:hypothetical protein
LLDVGGLNAKELLILATLGMPKDWNEEFNPPCPKFRVELTPPKPPPLLLLPPPLLRGSALRDVSQRTTSRILNEENLTSALFSLVYATNAKLVILIWK